MYDRILVPTDGSEGSAHAAMRAVDLAGQYGASIHALYVVDESVRDLLGGLTGSGRLTEQGRHALDQVAALADTSGVEDAEGAERLAADALADAGFDADIVGTRRQTHLWVVEAEREGDAGDPLVYVDPVTQQTSVVPRPTGRHKSG